MLAIRRTKLHQLDKDVDDDEDVNDGGLLLPWCAQLDLAADKANFLY